MQTFAIYLCFGLLSFCSTRSLVRSQRPIPFFIYPLRMHDFSIHCVPIWQYTRRGQATAIHTKCSPIQPNSKFMCMQCAEFTCELLSRITRIRRPSVPCRFRHPRQNYMDNAPSLSLSLCFPDAFR